KVNFLFFQTHKTIERDPASVEAHRFADIHLNFLVGLRQAVVRRKRHGHFIADALDFDQRLARRFLKQPAAQAGNHMPAPDRAAKSDSKAKRLLRLAETLNSARVWIWHSAMASASAASSGRGSSVKRKWRWSMDCI